MKVAEASAFWRPERLHMPRRHPPGRDQPGSTNIRMRCRPVQRHAPRTYRHSSRTREDASAHPLRSSISLHRAAGISDHQSGIRPRCAAVTIRVQTRGCNLWKSCWLMLGIQGVVRCEVPGRAEPESGGGEEMVKCSHLGYGCGRSVTQNAARCPRRGPDPCEYILVRLVLGTAPFILDGSGDFLSSRTTPGTVVEVMGGAGTAKDYTEPCRLEERGHCQ